MYIPIEEKEERVVMIKRSSGGLTSDNQENKGKGIKKKRTIIDNIKKRSLVTRGVKTNKPLVAPRR